MSLKSNLDFLVASFAPKKEQKLFKGWPTLANQIKTLMKTVAWPRVLTQLKQTTMTIMAMMLHHFLVKDGICPP